MDPSIHSDVFARYECSVLEIEHRVDNVRSFTHPGEGMKLRQRCRPVSSTARQPMYLWRGHISPHRGQMQLCQAPPCRRDPLTGDYLLHLVLLSRNKICDGPLWSTSFLATPPATSQRFDLSLLARKGPQLRTGGNVPPMVPHINSWNTDNLEIQVSGFLR